MVRVVVGRRFVDETLAALVHGFSTAGVPRFEIANYNEHALSSGEEASAIAYHDPVLGERVCAVVVPRPGITITLESIQTLFRDAGMAIFKWPERVRIVDALPRNAVGKVSRGELTSVAERAD